jgi:hypothetical protein
MNNPILISDERDFRCRSWVEERSMFISGIHNESQYHKYMLNNLILARLKELGCATEIEQW